MATERADSNYHSSGGATQGAGSLTLGDIEHSSHETKQEGVPVAETDSQPNSVDDKLRSGIYSQNDVIAENRSTTDGFDIRFDQNNLRVDKSDPSQFANIMREFGDLEIVDLGLSDSKVAAVLNDKGDAGASKGAYAGDGHLDHSEHGDDDYGEETHSYNGDRETQEAFARLATVVSRDSQIPDHLLQTLDRLNRQSSMSA
ncbi:hypothetical protein KF728_08985 [Candidatus Obscuribacterales bacterium]|nr:hypothetical protein [Candidatus Obscuribacterales bacterium]